MHVVFVFPFHFQTKIYRVPFSISNCPARNFSKKEKHRENHTSNFVTVLTLLPCLVQIWEAPGGCLYVHFHTQCFEHARFWSAMMNRVVDILLFFKQFLKLILSFWISFGSKSDGLSSSFWLWLTSTLSKTDGGLHYFDFLFSDCCLVLFVGSDWFPQWI